MSGGCGYCGRSGHSIDVCPERLERLYGTSADPSIYTENYMRAFGIDDESEETATDGGVIDPKQTKQASIQDYRTALEIREQEEKEIGSEEPPSWEPRDNKNPDTGARVRCDCGETVSIDFARVFGDNDDNVSNCIHCSTYREIHGNEIRYGGGTEI